jgi:hypothetical protein
MGASANKVQPTTIVAAVNCPFVAYAIHLISDFCGIGLTLLNKTGSLPDIYYGNDKDQPCKLRVPMVRYYDLHNVPGPSACTLAGGATCDDEVFPFDLFAAMRFWLADEGNVQSPESAFDVHGRLKAENSVQSQLNVLEMPVVNAYLLLFREWLKAKLRVVCQSRLPAGKKCAVVLSHDVDNPIDPGYPFHHLRLAHLALRKKKLGTSLRFVGNAILRGGYGLMYPAEKRWLFTDITKAEERYGFRSTFFFASKSKAEGHKLDVAYDVNTARFCQLFRQLASGDWEIGLHLSYRAGESSQVMTAERERLERLVKSEIKGARHHYWHLPRPFWDTLDRHAESGIKYDSSLSFNSAPGFRLGIAYPFRPWSPKRETSIKTLQIPTFLMDGALFEYGRQKNDAALDRVLSLLNNLKKYEGVAALDWHEYTSFPGSSKFRDWGQTYLNILEMLNADAEIAVYTGAEVLDRWAPSTSQMPLPGEFQ